MNSSRIIRSRLHTAAPEVAAAAALEVVAAAAPVARGRRSWY